jgi:hypothetical protein
MTATLTQAQVAEGVRTAIASYCQALDDGRTADLVATFCADGSAELPGVGNFHGAAALTEAYSRMPSGGGMRHVVVNTLVSDWNDHEATALSDVLVLAKNDGGWGISIVGRYHDTLHFSGGGWRFHARVLTFV